MSVRKTKIVATIGPASENIKTLTKMIQAGVNVTRLNFSHGDHKTHENRIKVVRSASSKAKIPIAVLQDLRGPKIRTGDLFKETIYLKKGATVTFTTEKIVGDAKRMSVSYKNLPKEVKRGTIILLDDGTKKLIVTSKADNWIRCRVLVGGKMRQRRGVNLPDITLKIQTLTAKDRRDIKFGIRHQVDFMALSFVRSARDIRSLKKILTNSNADIGVIAKIENKDAIDNIDEIILESDGIMVARGDLAVEVPPEDVPILQKKIIEKCNIAGKPVIIATQMLESMIYSPVPTRAEVSDISNSIFSGADALMLSAETAVGDYPVQVVDIMSRTAKKTEESLPHTDILKKLVVEAEHAGTIDTNNAISHYVVNTAHDIGADAIVALTESGFTARMIARYRPKQPIVVMSPNKRTLGRIILTFGCYPKTIKQFKYVGESIERIKHLVVKDKFAPRKGKIVISAGVPFGKVGGTNMLLVQKI